MREANTGCASVGLAPMTTMTSQSSTDLKSCVPAEVPKVCLSPKPVGEWQTRAQVSTLLLPKAARIIFCTTKTSSFVQREEVMPPMESTPWRAWIDLQAVGGVRDRLIPADRPPRVCRSSRGPSA